MKVWRTKSGDMYVPKKPWWGDSLDDDLEEVIVEKEELIVEGGNDDPYCHAGRWEIMWYDDKFGHSILTKIPWPVGKYKITIEPIKEDKKED